ncbi:lysophospholipid acyltransferase family protein [Microlunatus capsulatus]|uniref:1-acyl-sn-glycerol-3-phosphate acyltransferase n=1 Tax=Microlunatus capsulatus TaxID=99117 RepID=A0ABS4ZCU0_9ACTN|nr:lysophospholipid acyltransferase family protein [Microlunatus capsulatus]MBP2418819.1 1-acyl-sn-glycerol-3-phosphate acyltransferase [Microlunatus capsulatus]
MGDVLHRRAGTDLPPLAEVNAEPGGRTIYGVVSLLHAVIRPLTHRDWREQDKIPAEGGVVLVVNHISNVDPLAVGQFVAFSGRWPRFLAKESLFRIPVVGAVIRACGQIPVRRGTAAAQDALAAAVSAVQEGRAVVVYAEGTITRDPDLWPMRGRTGAARIALSTQAPVVPVGQWGAQDVMSGKKIHLPHLLPRKTFRLLVGDPVPLDDLRAQPLTAAVLAEATARIMAAVTALVAELRGEQPPAVPFDPRTATGVAR